MARATNAVARKKRHKKVLKQAKGYFGHKHIGFKTAKEQVRKSNEYAFRDRKNTKRNFRRLWIQRISAAVKLHDMNYSQFMYGLKLAEIEVNRKMLADIAVHDYDQFSKFVEEAKAAIAIVKPTYAPAVNTELKAAKEAKAARDAAKAKLNNK